MARSARPVFEIVDSTPIAIASTDSTTATTPAMPITMTNDEPSRCGTLRRFIAEIEVICPIALMRKPQRLGERVDDGQTVRAQRRRQPAQQRQHNRGDRADARTR